MANSAQAQTGRYSAFISYSHRDAGFARSLQRRLESYRLPQRVMGKARAGLTASRRLRPVFRDRASQRAASDITEVMREAIAESSFLIVICSPNSAVSSWVGREITIFREQKPAGTVLAALCEGAPAEAFHPFLLQHGADQHDITPLAADFRRHGDGARLALLKLVAVLAGVDLDDLVQRDAQRRVRQITAVSIGSLLGMSVAGLLAVAAIQARAAAEQERTRSERIIDFMLTDLRERLVHVGRLDLLNVVNESALRYYRGQNLTQLSPSDLEQRAKLLQDIGQDDLTRGHYASALGQFREAERTTRTLLAARPDNLNRVFAHSQSEYYVGLASWRLGDDAAAEAGFKAYAALTSRLVKAEPGNLDWRTEAGDADSNLGTFVLRHFADTGRAQSLFEASLVEFQAVAARRPADRDTQVNIADAYGWLGAVELQRRNYDRAYADRMMEHGIYSALLAGDPSDFVTRAQLVSNTLALARIAAARGSWTDALDQFRRGHEAAVALADADRQNEEIAREARAFELFEVRTWLMMPARQRPRAAIIARMLGDCRLDQAKENNEELVSFCEILHRRLSVQNGLTGLGPGPLARSMTRSRDVLSERWLLDLDTEAGNRRSS